MRLGPMTKRDRARVAELLLATAAFSDDEIVVAMELFDTAHADDPSPFNDYEFIAAFSEAEKIVGYGCFGPTPATEATHDLYWLAVDPEAQGQGIGTQLMKRIEHTLESRGARLLVVETSSRADYQDTRTFYARRGYAEAARVRDFYGPADDRIIFTTRLSTRDVGASTR